MVSSLIGLVYFTPIAMMPFYAVKKWRKTLPRHYNPKILLIPWVISISTVLLGEIVLSPILTMVGTGALVVSTITLVAGTVAFKLADKMP